MQKPKELKLPIKFHSGYFFDADGRMIAQMRGWGWMQYLDNAEDLQDNIGEWIAQKINNQI